MRSQLCKLIGKLTNYSGPGENQCVGNLICLPHRLVFNVPILGGNSEKKPSRFSLLRNWQSKFEGEMFYTPEVEIRKSININLILIFLRCVEGKV